MILRIEHLGIAVNNMENANRLFTALLGSPSYKVESVESEGVSTSFVKVGESKVELLEAMGEDSPVARFIAKRGEGIHHVAFEVDNIHAMMEQLRDQGFQLLSDQPRKGADNKLICFLHPKSTNGVLVELCQEIRG
ncbi:MAG TPA: methylmalonyl-CoA epimerase [Bacteroidia bacterium]|nr:methylmalonyl-CoA epimerase [Bacteroidia bacterium]